MMTISSRLLKRFSFLFWSCLFCFLPAFADFFTINLYTFVNSVAKGAKASSGATSFGSNANFAGIPPEAINVKNFYLQSINEPFQILPLIGKDSDGTIASFKIITRTANPQGRLMLNNAEVSNGQVLTPAEAKLLKFEPRSGFSGDASFTYSVFDNEGLTDASPATYTIPVTTNTSLLVCSGTGLGNNILGAQGTFSSPYITPNLTVSCINNGTSTAAPLNNLGNSKPLQTSYNYASTSGGLGPEGTYSFLKTLGTISPTNRNCIKTDWVASDHTGDGGYAMIVNGSPNSTSFGKTFFQSSGIAVCPNTLYEFSAYVINVLPGNHAAAVAGTEPNISFYINGQLVSTSGPIAYAGASVSYVPQWVKVGGLWYSGPNTTVDLKIDNATFVAGGNDLGLDDISMAICGPDISYPNIDLTAKFCSYGVLPLKADVKASINTYSAYIFQNSVDGGATWTDMGTPKIGSPVYNAGLNTYEYLAEYGDIPITPSMDGYRYRLKVATDVNNLTGTNCNVSADKVITVSTFNVPAGGADIIGCNPSPTAKLVAAGSGESWSTVAGNPVAAAIDQSGNVSGMTANGIYKFQLTNTAGCSDTVNVVRDEVKSAGADVKVCAPETTLKFADADTGYKWEAVAGNPAAATIDPATGQVSGLSAAGIYHFILRSDFGGCTDEVLVTKSSISLSNTKTDILCFGASTGAINLSVTGGTAPYTYAWNGGITTEDLTGLAAGTYNVTVTDANSCTATASVTISAPAAALALTSTKTDVLCFGTLTGSVNLSVTGGTAPYTYAWNGGITTEDLTGLAAGTYNVTVTDANSCTATASITISTPAAALALTSTKTDVLCFGASTGAVNLSVSGGTAPYTYAWTGGITSEDLTGLAEGTYNVTVTDAKGCLATVSVTISQPAIPLALTSSKTDVLCFGTSTGAINLSVSGGTAPYAFVWNGGITTEDLKGLVAGTYIATVTDANNCTATTSIIISAPTEVLTLTSAKTDVLCFGTSTGQINLNITGGFAPYIYSWDNGKTTEDLSNLVAGNYTATVTDSKGCTVKSTITISQPVALEVTASKTNVSCNGSNTGAISLNVRGGTAPFTYKWSNGQSTKDLTGIRSGNYKVIVTDAGNCSVIADVVISQSEPLNATLTVRNAGCLDSGGAISSRITGGVLPYKISWTGNSTSSAPEINNAKAGSYEMVVTDAAGCTVKVKAEIVQSACTPLAQNDVFELEQNKVLLGSVAPNDSNSQPDKLTFTKLTEPKNGKITFEPSGSFTFVPDNGFAGKVEFTYQLCNSTGGCDTANVSIDIKAITIVNLTPELSSVWEGRKVSVTARLTKPFNEDVTITVEFSGKAEKERDYLVLDQYLSIKIPKGSLSTTEKMTFAALNDGFQEGDEDIILKIKTVSNPGVHIGSGAVVIINDVYPPPPPTDVPQDEPINAEITPDALMSPNGDGNGNEAFKIENIEFYPDNEVLIFNRWGNSLFAIKNYNNSDRNFRGFANKGLLVNSDLPLSDGVYFYIVTTYSTIGVDRTKQVNKGYVILKR